ncbi:MAG: carbohydrate binding family 9 domain-containing protein, partial [Chloroflexi bacterium]|nr:carbohydrate binding family 9 domain-containing protein [Chloroflexota bacterium]
MPAQRRLPPAAVRRVLALALALGLAAAAPAGAGQGAGPPAPTGADGGLAVRPAAGPITIDGVLDEPAWAAAAVVPLTHEWLPGDNVAPPVATEALVTFDDARLYVAFRAHDPQPAAIRAHLADRDNTFVDDAVGFAIDTFNDRRRAYRFEVNPLGVQRDAIVSDVDDSADASWDAIWDAAGRITEAGYTVEVAVPFRQLRFPRADGEQTWGFLAQRIYPRSVVHELYSTVNRRDLDCLVCQYTPMTGFTRIETGHNLEVVPTVTADRTDARADLEGPLETGEEDAEGGLTVRWGMTDNVTLLGAVNPDFSQVEADAAQLNVNERFALFFPEKRPFFLEGADVFSTRLRAVFTRTVADPAFGLKTTGKEGANAFGVFVAEDRINNLIFPGAFSSGLGSIDEHVRSGVVRWRRDVGGRSTLGLLYAGRDGEGDYQNHVYGIDGTLRLTDSDSIRFQALGSTTRYPDAVALEEGQPEGSFDGLAAHLLYSHATRNWTILGELSNLDEDFRADSGFIPQVDLRKAGLEIDRTFWGSETSWYSRFLVAVNLVHSETQEGELFEDSVNLDFIYDGPRQTRAWLGIRPNRERFDGVTYEDLRSDLRLSIRPSGDFFAELFLRGGEIIDFVNSRQSEFFRVVPKVEFNLGPR